MAQKLGVGMLGYGFMGKAHTNAFKKANYIFYPMPVETELISICGRDEDKIREAAQRYGYQRWNTDWRELINAPDIDIFDNTGSNNVHAEPCIAALQAGKHVIVEKPFALNLEEAKSMSNAAREADKKGIRSIVAFNYRFAPALRLARRIIAESRLGTIYHFRSQYLLDRLSDPQAPFFWRMDRKQAGSGVLGDLNSHAIDMMRFLLQVEPVSVMAWNTTFIKNRCDSAGNIHPIDTDDASALWLKLENGAMATFEASKVATGYKTMWRIEIHGSKGGLVFDLSKGNDLQFFTKDDPLYLQGMKTINATEPEAHDYAKYWWPRGHNLGWEHFHIHMIEHFLRCIATGENIAPWGATFEDGLRCQEIISAALQSSEEGRWIKL
ncbi:Gfo/Idh/MocA family protein [Desulfitobacterium sp. AusDCA]|uniref:Gfo/Idh/MocA family protein n=1 Tax=Desulfitobacterium sp. AusDCA TaxID=3240383 RepID=UPI003DA77D70